MDNPIVAISRDKFTASAKSIRLYTRDILTMLEGMELSGEHIEESAGPQFNLGPIDGLEAAEHDMRCVRQQMVLLFAFGADAVNIL